MDAHATGHSVETSRAGSRGTTARSASKSAGAPSRHRAFHKPVVVQTGRIDRERVIADTRDAAEVLLRDWPGSDCPKRLRAMRACLDVIHARRPPSHARNALIAAAREARVLIEG
jgi:hypothetical protein